MKTAYINGVVYTGTLPCVQAFATEDGKFVCAGTNEEVQALNAEETVDLGGKFVCAGFNDSHMHLLNYGQMLNAAQLGDHTESLEDMIQCMIAFAEANPAREGVWIRGRGWNHDYFCDCERMPSRYDLDRVSTTNPVIAIRCCGHCLVVNSKALEVAGITAETAAPEGGAIGIEDGAPDGRFYDNAMQLIYNVIPVPDKETIKDYIRAACKGLNAYGVTSSQTDDYCVFRELHYDVVNDAYRELEEAGELTVRVYEQSNFETMDKLTEFVENGNVTGVGTDFFKIGPLKMLGDGSLGARTAFMSEPYADDPTTCGLSVFTQEQFDEMIGYANAHNMQVAIHTIGDACLDRVLTAVEKALAENPREDHRHGIVHCQISRPEQLQKIADLNMHVYAQSIFLDYDIHIIEDRVGKEKAASSYSWKTLMNKGVSVSNGTDCPVEKPDVLKCMQCAVTRTTVKDQMGPYLPEEAFTVQEALDSYTIRSAEGSFEENVKGLIKPGYMADFVVLGANPFEVDPQTIYQIPVAATYVGGKLVYTAE